MDEREVVSPSRIERLLELACAYNVPLTVTVESGDKLYTYRSRMLEQREKVGANSLLVDYPMTSGPAIALKPGMPLTVHFSLEKQRFLFHASVIGKTLYTFLDRRKATVLEIEYPTVLVRGQRRSYHRVPPPPDQPISVNCRMTGDVIDWLDKEAESAGSARQPTQFRGTIVNVSVGGMLMAVRETEQPDLEEGKKVGLRFSVAKKESPILIKGIIRRIEEDESTGELRVAIEWIDTEEMYEYRLAMNRIYKYVAERQREVIAPKE